MEEGKEGKEEMIVMQTGTGYVVMLIKFFIKDYSKYGSMYSKYLFAEDSR